MISNLLQIIVPRELRRGLVQFINLVPEKGLKQAYRSNSYLNPTIEKCIKLTPSRLPSSMFFGSPCIVNR